MLLPWFGILAIVALLFFGAIVLFTRGKVKGSVASMLIVLALFAIIIILFALRVS